MTYGAGAGAAAAQMIASAIKAAGPIVRVDELSFREVLHRAPEPLVIIAKRGIFTTKYIHMTSYKGFCFWYSGLEVLDLPKNAEVIEAKKVWIPDL